MYNCDEMLSHRSFGFAAAPPVRAHDADSGTKARRVQVVQTVEPKEMFLTGGFDARIEAFEVHNLITGKKNT